MRTRTLCLTTALLGGLLTGACGRDPLSQEALGGGSAASETGSGSSSRGSGSATGSSPVAPDGGATGAPSSPGSTGGGSGSGSALADAGLPGPAPGLPGPMVPRDAAVAPLPLPVLPPPTSTPDAASPTIPGPPVVVPTPAADAGAAAPACPWPACLAPIMAMCPTTGTCVQERMNNTANLCYAGGTRVTTLTNGGRGMPTTISGKVSKADGSTCYLFDGQLGGFGGGGGGGGFGGGSIIVYRSAAGPQIATGTLGMNGQLLITCPGGLPQMVPLQCQPGLFGGGGGGGGGFPGPGGGGGGCTQGTCQ